MLPSLPIDSFTTLTNVIKMSFLSIHSIRLALPLKLQMNSTSMAPWALVPRYLVVLDIFLRKAGGYVAFHAYINDWWLSEALWCFRGEYFNETDVTYNILRYWWAKLYIYILWFNIWYRTKLIVKTFICLTWEASYINMSTNLTLILSNKKTKLIKSLQVAWLYSKKSQNFVGYI